MYFETYSKSLINNSVIIYVISLATGYTLLCGTISEYAKHIAMHVEQRKQAFNIFW